MPFDLFLPEQHEIDGSCEEGIPAAKTSQNIIKGGMTMTSTTSILTMETVNPQHINWSPTKALSLAPDSGTDTVIQQKVKSSDDDPKGTDGQHRLVGNCSIF